MKTVFIHTNNKQYIGAVLGKFSIEKNLPVGSDITVRIINVDNLPVFKAFSGKTYLRGGKKIVYDPNDLQSFTLSRFMPPEEMHFEGRALVIDPDIFATGDISPLMNIDMKGHAIAACKKGESWQSSSMLMDCSKLTHLKISDLLSRLEKKEMDYTDIMSLKKETSILELPSIWNSLDALTPETKLLHTTNRLTQPWRTGLPIDFTRSPMPKIFGIIPREPIQKLLGKYPTKYQSHPNKEIEIFFLSLVKEAMTAGALTEEMLKKEVSLSHVRKDIFEKLNTL